LLASCYRSSFALAAQNQIKTIAFPAISCGVYSYPVDEAVEIALNETLRFLETHAAMEKVIFACFEQDIYDAYLDAFARAPEGERNR
jgi:O-acetyl-ADP-ribose deacetylase